MKLFIVMRVIFVTEINQWYQSFHDDSDNKSNQRKIYNVILNKVGYLQDDLVVKNFPTGDYFNQTCSSVDFHLTSIDKALLLEFRWWKFVSCRPASLTLTINPWIDDKKTLPKVGILKCDVCGRIIDNVLLYENKKQCEETFILMKKSILLLFRKRKICNNTSWREPPRDD